MAMTTVLTVEQILTSYFWSHHFTRLIIVKLRWKKYIYKHNKHLTKKYIYKHNKQ